MKDLLSLNKYITIVLLLLFIFLIANNLIFEHKTVKDGYGTKIITINKITHTATQKYVYGKNK